MRFIPFIVAFSLFVPAIASAHPARAGLTGCHVCRGDNCWRYGVRDGQYHCHKKVRLGNRQTTLESEQKRAGERRRIANRRRVRARRAEERRLRRAAPAEPLKDVRFIEVETSQTIIVRPDDGMMRVVRLLGVDAPPMNLETWRESCFGTESHRKLRQIITRPFLSLARPEGVTMDQEGRLLRYVMQSGVDIGAKLIGEGYAYSDDTVDHPLKKKYDQLEHDAFWRRRGLWGTVCGYPNR